MGLPLLPVHIACLYIPDFRLQVSLNQLGGEPEGGLALVDPEDGRRVVVAASCGARLDGVRRGMTSVTATALAPELTVRTIDRAELAVVHSALEAAVRRVTPQIESTGAGVIYASFSGLERRYEEEGRGGFLDDLRDAAIELDLPARVGMASCRFVARCAAIIEPSDGRPIVVCSGQEREFLAPLSLRLLPDAMSELRVLEQLGLKSLGELAQLPSSGLVRRFGERGGVLQRLARGEDRTKLIPSREPQRFFQRVHSELPVAQLEPLLFLLRRPLSALLSELREQSLAAGALRWELKLDDSSFIEGCARAASPSPSMRLWSDLIKLDMERTLLQAAVLAIDLEVVEFVNHIPDQVRILRPRRSAPGAMSRTLAHLKTELGQDGFGRRSLRPSLLPENREEWAGEQVFADTSARDSVDAEAWLPYEPRVEEQGSVSGSLGNESRVELQSVPCLTSSYRQENPALPLEVQLERGVVQSFRCHFGSFDVLKTEGPWDISGEWWSRGVRRRYFQVTGRAVVAWIYLEPESRCWFLAGWLD
jgi:nucleotidyltransferase/DNA polymerase involved in DNA repair